MNNNLDLEQPVKELTLPAPHLMARLVRANETYMLAGRGTFKTSRGIALYLVDKVYEMPRSTGVAVGLSFEHLNDNTIPPLLSALEEFGFKVGEHYVIGTRPPKEWPRPYLGVINEKYDHVMTWENGTIVYLISLVKKASANGISAQWGFFDEAKFMDERTLIDEIFPIFRGNEETKRLFSGCSGYLSKFFATDKNADPAQIKWLLNKRKLVNQQAIDIVITLQLELNRMEMDYETAGINRRGKMRPVMADIKEKLARLRSSLVHVVEVSAYDVLYAHGEKWLKDKQRNSREHDFRVQYENRDPDRPGEAFYPDFDTNIHTYDDENDINTNAPFIIAADYQHSIAPIPIAQISKLPTAIEPTLNYVDEVYKMDPEGLQEAILEFCMRYRNHQKRTVFYVFDQTATGKRVNADPYYVMVKRILKMNRWAVIDVYTGQVPTHYMKYLDTRGWLTHRDITTMQIRINQRCAKLIVSITGSAATTKNGRTEKDKKGEQNPLLDQSETTHFSDTFDMINHAVLKLRKVAQSKGMGPVQTR